MKGATGLVVAVFLGLMAAVMNWVYLTNKAGQFKSEQFLGIGRTRDGKDQVVPVGAVLREENFVAVAVPQQYAANLKDSVYLYQEKGTVAGIRATRPFKTGDLVFREDYRTPAREVSLGPDERLIWVTVSSDNFVPGMIDPGDLVTFVVPRGPAAADAATSAVGSPELIGPFTVGSLGTRLGKREVAQGYQLSQSQERQIGIIVQLEGGNLEPRAARLLELSVGGSRNIAVMLHPRVHGSE